jgi:hypothetical protein
MLVKIYIAQIARLSTLQSKFSANQIIFKRKLCVKGKGTTIYSISYPKNAFYRHERMLTDPMIWIIRREFFRAGLKKGGPKFTIYLVPPFYVNGLRLAIGS